MNQIGVIHPEPPYDFAALLELLRHFPHAVLNHVSGESCRRVITVHDQLLLVDVVSRGTTDRPALEVSLLAGAAPDPATSEARRSSILTTLQYLLAAHDHRRQEFVTFCHLHPPLWRVVEPLFALPAVRTASVFEALASAIIEQQISWRGALKAQRWLVEWGGRGIDYDGQCWYAHPTPEQIAGASLPDLKPLKITDKRIRLLIEVAAVIAAGKLELRGLPVQDAYQRLTAIKGIGHWTAALTLSRMFGSAGYVGTNDVALQAAVNWYFYGRPGKASAAMLTELFAGFGVHAGLVADLVLARWVIERY